MMGFSLTAAMLVGMAAGCMAFHPSSVLFNIQGSTKLPAHCRASFSCARRQGGVYMSAAVVPMKLSNLELQPYINGQGQIPFDPSKGNIGVYAIFDEMMTLRFLGQSRYCDNSLRCHLGRMPSECYFFKIQTVERPSRTILDDIKKAWTEEAGAPTDNDNGEHQARWESAINVQKHVELSATEKKALADMSSENTIKTLRDICRRVQQDIEDVLSARGFKDKIQFNPKLKEQGLLDVSSVKIAAVEVIGEDTKLDVSLQTKSDRKGAKGMQAAPM